MAQSKNQPILSIDRFFTGLYTRRNPLFTPFRSVGINVVQFHDALIDGLNVELSDNYTLQRRPGFPVYCSQAFGVSEWPLAFYSVRDLTGTVYPLTDTQSRLATFNTSSIVTVIPKNTTAQGFVQQVGSKTYYANGVDFQKWFPAGVANQVTNFGIAPPINPPTVSPPLGSPSAAASFWFPDSQYTDAIILDSNGNFQSFTNPGARSGPTTPIWNTNVGLFTYDGPVGQYLWINSGAYATGWQANFTIPYGTSVTFGGYTIIDSNGNIQQTVAGGSGVTGATQPAWNPVPGGTTADNTVTWLNRGPGAQLVQFGYQWCYAYRTIFGHLSSASPLSGSTLQIIGGSLSIAISGAGTGDAQCGPNAAGITNIAITANILTVTAVNHYVPGLTVTFSSVGTSTFLNGQNVQILSATATQFTAYFVHANVGSHADTGTVTFLAIEIYRIADGGSIFYYSGAVANPGAGVTWNYTDTVSDANLETQLIAPLFHLNDPPPGAPGSLIQTGGALMAWWQGRIWMASGNNLFFDAGPDCLNGIPEEAWPPANVFTYPGPITSLAPTSQGLIVQTSDRWFVVLGGPQTLTFYDQPLLQNFGISNPNCLAQDGDQLYLYTTSQQYFSVSVNGKSEDGWRVGDLLQANFPSASSYVTMHRAGQDTGVFLSNGGAIGSVETSPGIYTLLLGPTTGSGRILARNLTTFSDGQAIASTKVLRYGLNTSAWSPVYQTAAGAYSATASIGSITLSLPGGPPVPLASVLTNFVNVGTRPSLSILWNEISANSVRGFISIPTASAIDLLQSEHVNTSQSMLYLKWPTNANEKREPTLAHNVQIKIDFGSTDTVKNELLYLGLDD
jgi:hypothetical protein